VVGPLVGGLVAHEDGQVLGNAVGFSEGFALQSDGALLEPVALGHFLNEQSFGDVGGPVAFE
jgi:hypothetical protein